MRRVYAKQKTNLKRPKRSNQLFLSTVPMTFSKTEEIQYSVIMSEN